jgi:hypothetical protein
MEIAGVKRPCDQDGEIGTVPVFPDGISVICPRNNPEERMEKK